MTAVKVRTQRIPEGGLVMPGLSISGSRSARASDGSMTFVLNEPADRRWGAYGALDQAEPVSWALESESPDGVVIKAGRPGADVDLLELTPEAAEAFVEDDPEPLVVSPAFKPLGSARDLGQYLVGSTVLTGPSFKKPVDSTALSIYRIARHRGGPLWLGVADHVADVTVRRIMNAPAGELPHDLLSAGETHVRFMNDSLLLAAAHHEFRLGELAESATSKASTDLRSFMKPVAAGQWLVHDSLERDDHRNDLVLNTHLQGMLALKAAGADIRPMAVALEHVLARQVEGISGLRSAGLLAASETVRAVFRGRGGRLRYLAHRHAANACSRSRALRVPGGWLHRDVSGTPAPPHYLTVNLTDLAAVLANFAHPPWIAQTLFRAIRFGQTSGFLKAEIAQRSPLSPLIPVALRLAGMSRASEQAAQAELNAGGAPMIGWPGYTDSLWSNLAPGTP